MNFVPVGAICPDHTVFAMYPNISIGKTLGTGLQTPCREGRILES
jgi:hypothetical protein